MLITITKQSPLSYIYTVGDTVLLNSIITKIMSFHNETINDTHPNLKKFLDTMSTLTPNEIRKTIVEMCTPHETRKRTYDEAFGSDSA